MLAAASLVLAARRPRRRLRRRGGARRRPQLRSRTPSRSSCSAIAEAPARALGDGGRGARARSLVAAADSRGEPTVARPRPRSAVAPTATRPALAAARATIRRDPLRRVRRHVRATARGDVASARSWLLVREFRPPTRFSRAAADATLALDELEAGAIPPAAAPRRSERPARHLRGPAPRVARRDPRRRRRRVRRDASRGRAALGYWAIVRPAYAHSAAHGDAPQADCAFERSRAAARSRARGASAAVAASSGSLEGFRAAPLSRASSCGEPGQLDRFLRLVPIEYGRGVSDGRVTLDFEIQEAITFRDGAAAAFHDLEPTLLARDAAATRRSRRRSTRLGDALAAAARGGVVAEPDSCRGDDRHALGLIDRLYPNAWKEAAETADFDVIAATLDRLQAAAAAGDWRAPSQARLEAYGVFELGPEQRLRGLAPSLFQEVEGFFWYGAGDTTGSFSCIKRKAADGELAADPRGARRRARGRRGRDRERAAGSDVSIVTNSAIIVFREGLEAVLILAALMASLVGPQRRHRRRCSRASGSRSSRAPSRGSSRRRCSTSLARYGERLEAVVSLVAIGVLLLILNWFYHRVYWQENLQDLHGGSGASSRARGCRLPPRRSSVSSCSASRASTARASRRSSSCRRSRSRPVR